MNLILSIGQIIVSILLVICILLQKSGSQIFGKEGTFYRTLRGAEKKLFWATLVLGFIFIALGVLNLLIS